MRTRHLALSTSATIAGGMVMLSILAMPGRAVAADNYRLFRFDLGGVYTQSYSTGDKGGGLLLEPMFNVTDQFSVGFREEITFAGGGSYGESGASFSVRTQSTSLAKGEYYMLTGPLRPFVSVGAGLYRIAAMSMQDNRDQSTITELGGSYFGVAPQLGVELGVFRMSILYEAILGAYAESKQVVTTGAAPKVLERKSLNYIGFEISFRIGGGMIERPVAAPAPVEGDGTIYYPQ
jgi:hypothetical protein